MTFFCPLCSTPRSIAHTHKLSKKNYIQILILTAFTTFAAFPFCGFKGVFSLFIYLAAFEFTARALFKKDIPCPHCGFDASWYKKDVKVARTKVDEFWSKQTPLNAGQNNETQQENRLESADL